MNAHFIDAADVLDVFADAQRLGIRYRNPVHHVGPSASVKVMRPRPPPEQAPAPLPFLRRFPTRASRPAGVALRALVSIDRAKAITPLQTSHSTCIRCGGTLEWREGLRHPVHLGRCVQTLAQAAE